MFHSPKLNPNYCLSIILYASMLGMQFALYGIRRGAAPFPEPACLEVLKGSYSMRQSGS